MGRRARFEVMDRVVVEPGAYEKFGVEQRKQGVYEVLRMPTRGWILPSESLSTYRIQLRTKPPVIIYVEPRFIRHLDIVERLAELEDERG